MRICVLTALLGVSACSSSPSTTLLVRVSEQDGAAIPLRSATISVFDGTGLLVRGQVVPARLPGSLTVSSLPDRADLLRVVVSAESATGPLLGGVQVMVAPKTQTRVQVVLGGAAGDSDGDGVPDALDDCPMTPDPDQTSSTGSGPGDACRTGTPVDLAPVPPDLPDLAPPPICVVSGSAGSALQFASPSSTSVDLGPSLPIPDDFTIEAWIYPTAPNGEQMVFSKDTAFDAANQFRFGLFNGSNVSFFMTDATSSSYGLGKVTTTATVPTNAWSHIAITKRGTAFVVYIDGVAAKSGSATQSIKNTGTMNARIGGRNGTQPFYFDGIIDEVRVWDLARSPAELACAMNGEVTAADPSYAHLIYYWKLDENGGTVTHSATGKRDGTLSNSPAWVASTAF